MAKKNFVTGCLSSEPFFFMCMFVFIANIFTLPQLIQDRVCRNSYNDTVCSHLSSRRHKTIQDLVQKEAAGWMAFIPLTALVPAVFILCMLGPFCDVFGIRNTMIIPPAVLLLQSITYMILSYLKGPFSPGLFIIAACLSGLFGENMGCEALAMSYVAHVTSVKDRTLRMTFLESSLFLASCVSGLINGAILWKFGFPAVFICTAIVNSINFLYVTFLLPSEHIRVRQSPPFNDNNMEKDNQVEEEEIYVVDTTLSPKSNGENISSDQDGKSLSTQEHGTFIEAVKTACSPCRCIAKIQTTVCNSRDKWKMIALLIFLFLTLLPNMGEIYMGVLYLTHRPFNLSPMNIGYLVAYKAALTAIGISALIAILQHCLGVSDHGLLILGYAGQTIYFILLGVSVSTLMLYLIQFVGFTQVIHLPVLRSLISKQVDSGSFGTALAIGEVVDALSTLTTTLVSNSVYSGTVSIYPGLAFLILSIVAFSALIGSIVFYKKEKNKGHLESYKKEQSSESVRLLDKKN